MDAIMAVAEKHGLRILEDCAEAHFATYKDKKIGSFGDMAAFSTYVAHTITMGIGGVITTNNLVLTGFPALLSHMDVLVPVRPAWRLIQDRCASCVCRPRWTSAL